jgi:hypothetical protein
MLQILCTHVCKWKNETTETIPGMGGGEVKENDGWVNLTMIYYKNYYKCHNVS